MAAANKDASPQEMDADRPPVFLLPVDSEHKARVINLLSVAQPHMRAFHLSWFSFMVSFVSTFAAAPLTPIIRDNLNLTKTDLGNAGVAAVTGTICARVVMGQVCDIFGPRYGHSFLMIGVAPAVFCMSLVQNAAGFITCRCLIGFSLATFVATQYWTSQMFSPKIVGLANATTAGWGNLGGGVTQFLMPLIYTGMLRHASEFSAWRLSFFVPGCLHLLVGLLVLFFSQDLPDGNFQQLKKKGDLSTTSPVDLMKLALMNYRMWALVISYGFCFGIELTMNNIVTTYFFDQFNLPLEIAGIIGALFGMMNLFARSIGGITSDACAARFGMRGRLWALYLIQTSEGVMCVLMGRMYNSLPSTIVCMVLFSALVQMAEGATFGVVPFLSKRTLGVCSGFIGAGGNAGGAITMAIFFKSDAYSTYDGITYMGVMVIAITTVIALVHFPQWGSMFLPPNPAYTEKDYYLKEYTAEEQASGLAHAAEKFAQTAMESEGSFFRTGVRVPSAPKGPLVPLSPAAPGDRV